MTECVLVADLGAGGLRAALVTAADGMRGPARRSLATASPHPGWMEAEPEPWWRALSDAAAALLARHGRARVLGVCLTGMTRSQVFLDRSGTVLRPAILWGDVRAEADAADAARCFAPGNPATAVNAFHPLARLAWLRRAEPAAWDALATVLEPKDWLNRRLTGVTAGDGVTAARLDPLGQPLPGAPDWLGRALGLLRLPAPMPWEAIGTVRCPDPPWDALRGVPVFAGSQDGWAGAVGAGAVRPGDAYDICGTSEVAGLLLARPAAAPGLVGLPWTPCAWHLGGPTQAGGGAARWAHRTFRAPGSLAAALERAGRLGRDPAALPRLPHFVPYLSGERAPLWRADIRAAFALVAAEHGPDALLWAVMEGVTRSVADILDAAARASGQRPAGMRLAGGGGRSAAWAQLRADVLGIPVLRPAHLEAGLLGCAAAAWTGLGAFPSLPAATGALNPVRDALWPDPARADAFALRAERHRHLRGMALGLPLDRPASTTERDEERSGPTPPAARPARRVSQTPRGDVP